MNHLATFANRSTLTGAGILMVLVALALGAVARRVTDWRVKRDVLRSSAKAARR